MFTAVLSKEMKAGYVGTVATGLAIFKKLYKVCETNVFIHWEKLAKTVVSTLKTFS